MSSNEIARQHRFLRSFTAHEPALRAFARRLLPTRADADDVMQEISVVLWDKFEQFREGSDFRAWAFGVARYEVLAWLRDKGRDRLVLEESVVELLADEAGADEPRLAEQRSALDACLKKLPPSQRELLIEAYHPEAQIQKVASRSGRSIPGFYQWLHRVRQMLLDCIRRSIAESISS